jgi:hypothetical protein
MFFGPASFVRGVNKAMHRAAIVPAKHNGTPTK